jgi:hypothetical protein
MFRAEHFAPQASRESAKRLFKHSVSRIEVETHSYCNRRCGYCPNVVGDRLTPNVRMSDRIFAKIIGNLEEIAYGENLVLSNYNEPFADRHIVERIAQARRALPKCRILAYTNGDYLDADYLRELAEAGLSYMHISIHMNPEDTYSDVYALNRIAEVAERIGIRPKFGTLRPGSLIIATFLHQRIEIETRAINYWQHGQNRGGTIQGINENYVRRAPCHFPFGHFYVGFEGYIVPCCHLRSDRQEHAKYRWGHIDDYGSIYEAFASQPAVAWRRHLATFEPKQAPCDTCSVGFLDNSKKTMETYKRIYDSTIKPILEGKPAPDRGSAVPPTETITASSLLYE